MLSKQIGDKIRALRTAKEFSQESMATALDMSLSGFAKIERGETDVSVSRLSKIAEVLSVPLNSFLEDELRLNITQNEVVFVHNHGTYQGKNESAEIQDLKEDIKLLKRMVAQLSDEIAFLKKNVPGKPSGT